LISLPRRCISLAASSSSLFLRASAWFSWTNWCLRNSSSLDDNSYNNSYYTINIVVTSHLQIISTDNSIVCRYDVIPKDNSFFESFSKWRGLQAFWRFVYVLARCQCILFIIIFVYFSLI
jgi:hypothetical protein